MHLPVPTCTHLYLYRPQVRALRVEVNRAFEVARSASLIGATLEAKLLLHVEEPGLAAALKTWDTQSGNGVDELRFLFIASQVEPRPQPSP